MEHLTVSELIALAFLVDNEIDKLEKLSPVVSPIEDRGKLCLLKDKLNNMAVHLLTYEAIQ